MDVPFVLAFDACPSVAQRFHTRASIPLNRLISDRLTKAHSPIQLKEEA
jgi:hypothetical protein